jgi:hypothetical protein
VKAKASDVQAGTSLSLCGFFMAQTPNGCTRGGGATAPFNARHVLVARAVPRLRTGDSIRIVGRQTDPTSRFLGVLRECFKSPCLVRIGPPQRSGRIVAADYWAYLVRGGVPTPRIRSNVLRYAWKTTRVFTWAGTWSAARWGGRVICTETATTVNCTYDWGGGGTYTATKTGENTITGTWQPNTPGGNPGGPFDARVRGTTFDFTDRSQGQNLKWSAECVAGPCLNNG